MKYVIVGNSAAAIGCIEGIRSVDSDGSIVVITNEAYHTYSRPLISYLLLKKTDEQKMKYRDDDFYNKMNVDVLFSVTATKINSEEKYVLADDKKVPYDKLLIATGSSPFVPEIKNADKVSNSFTFMSLDDAKALEKTLTKESKVLIMGAGLIGLKCAEGIRDSVASVTVVDLADRILQSILNKEGSEIVQKHIESKGVEFRLNNSVAEFSKNGATLKNGDIIAFDVLVIAIGVRPNVKLAQDAGISVDKGIVVNEKCETSAKNIYAAGDCTLSYDISSDTKKILALLPSAYLQGECAGINMAGGEKIIANAIPMNAIGFFSKHIITAGTYDGETYEETSPGSYKKLFYKDNRLVGYILIGDIKRAGIYTSLIRNKTQLGGIDFELIKRKPQLMAFSEKKRKQTLGGVV